MAHANINKRRQFCDCSRTRRIRQVYQGDENNAPLNPLLALVVPGFYSPLVIYYSPLVPGFYNPLVPGFYRAGGGTLMMGLISLVRYCIVL